MGKKSMGFTKNNNTKKDPNTIAAVQISGMSHELHAAVKAHVKGEGTRTMSGFYIQAIEKLLTEELSTPVVKPEKGWKKLISKN